MTTLLIGLAVGLACGGAAWFLEHAARRDEAAVHAQHAAALQAQVEMAQRQLADHLADAGRAQDAFKALAADALRDSGEAFLRLADQHLEAKAARADGQLARREEAVRGLMEQVLRPLAALDQQIQGMERERGAAYGQLREQVAALTAGQARVAAEAGNLAKALRAPQVRGRWGEVQLRRVVELAGMTDHCDFYEQASQDAGDGKLRPDLVVRLPGGKTVVVDSKAPLYAYLDAVEAQDDAVRAAKLQEHAGQVATHVRQLSEKRYWALFKQAPEFVVLFLPGEAFLSAALERDPALLESAAERRVILASPATLIALLKAVYYGWRQEQVEANAERVAELGRELHDRVAVMGEHLAALGAALGKSVGEYNRAVSSYETRVLSGARRFRELGAQGKKDVPELAGIDANPQPPVQG